MKIDLSEQTIAQLARAIATESIHVAEQAGKRVVVVEDEVSFADAANILGCSLNTIRQSWRKWDLQKAGHSRPAKLLKSSVIKFKQTRKNETKI